MTRMMVVMMIIIIVIIAMSDMINCYANLPAIRKAFYQHLSILWGLINVIYGQTCILFPEWEL